MDQTRKLGEVDAPARRGRARRAARAGRGGLAAGGPRARPGDGRPLRRDVRRRAAGPRDVHEYAKVRAHSGGRSAPSRRSSTCARTCWSRSRREVDHLLRRLGRRRGRATRARRRDGQGLVSDAYRKVAGDGIQIHGGIGFTWEHDLHLYFKRAKGSEVRSATRRSTASGSPAEPSCSRAPAPGEWGRGRRSPG